MILKSLKTQETQQVSRLSFESDPQNIRNSYGSLYRVKNNLVPDNIIKRISGPQGDDLICAILQARSNMISSFGRPRSSRFSLGFDFEEMPTARRQRTPEEQKEIKKKIGELKETLWNCGSREVDDEYFHPNFSQFLKMITRDGLSFGRCAVEFIYKTDVREGKKLVAFRPVDAGTIYRVVPKKEADQSARAEGMRLLSEIKNERLEVERYEKDEYKYVQVIDGRPLQAFTEEEMVVYNFYPVTGVEYNGYPLTPIDQTLNAITTHINITLHNKLYFQNGRASRGMLIFQSEDLDESVLQKIRLQFHQSINSVSNSWRMPVFGVGQGDQLTWQAIDSSGRDMEFISLMDNNARVILSAYQMSPEELPGYAHLARGTNSQALAESDNEWKLSAARDSGLRPLIADITDLLNTHILPKFDEKLSDEYQIVFAGLDKDSPEKEATRLSQDMPIHMTMNDVMKKVEKDPYAKEMGGDFPLNPQFQAIMDKYLTVGQIMQYYMGVDGAAMDPRYQYMRDPFWIQFQQLVLQKTQIAMQNIMMQQQQATAAAGGAVPGQDQGQGNDAPPQEEQAPLGASDAQKAEIAANNLRKQQEWLAGNYLLLEKGIKHNHDELSKMILARHKEQVGSVMKKWKADAKAALESAKKALE
jgi:hypothetical protein